jgi:rhamnosyltransferase
MKTFAVIVTYRPEISQLQKTIFSLQNQVEKIIVVKNSAENFGFENEKIQIVQLEKNMGIAFAQNRGIEKSFELGAQWILLSDQDTIFPENYVQSFLPFIQKKSADVYCPIFFDSVKNIFSPVMIKKFRGISGVREPVFVQHAISSGSLIARKTFERAGLMDEKLFIDYVDFEWCWRAVSNGMKILTVPSVKINHRLGDGSKKILKWNVTIRSDARYFYMIRNGFYLSFFCLYLKFSEKIILFFRTIKFCIGVFLLRHDFSTLKLEASAFFCALNKILGEKK